MKRYIHAAFDASIPSWLQRRLSSRFGDDLKSKLLKKYNIALDRAQFLDYAPANSLPFYLLQSDYGTVVYVPGANDDTTAYFNGRSRKLGSLAKSKLPEIATDVVWLDLDDANNTFTKKARYEDPRYSYRNSSRGTYAGQYQREPYLGDGKYGEKEWSKTGTTPSNERRARDKSGYKVPSPEEKIADYYSRFPERVTDKVDQVYDRIVEVKQKLMDADFNSPADYSHSDNYSEAYRTFSEVIYKYRALLNSLDSDRRLKQDSWSGDYAIREFSQTISIIKDYLKEVEKLLSK